MREVGKNPEVVEDYLQDPESLRRQVVETVRKFKGNWIELGKYLALVREGSIYKKWDYGSFPGYCTRELKLKKTTVDKLLHSYQFLVREEPSYLKSALSGGASAPMPDYESVDVLRKARGKKQISERDYNEIRSSVLEDGAGAREVGKQYRSLLEAARDEPQDDRQAWDRRRLEVGRRTLVSLRRIRENLESDRYFSPDLVDQLKDVIKKVESELSQE